MPDLAENQIWRFHQHDDAAPNDYRIVSINNQDGYPTVHVTNTATGAEHQLSRTAFEASLTAANAELVQ